MNDPDAAYDLLRSYNDALILSCFEQVRKDVQTTGLELEQEHIKDVILNTIVDQYAIPHIPDGPKKTNYECQHCNKTYKRVKSLRNHIQKKHNEVTNQHQGIQASSSEDGVLNYACNALSLGLIARSFVDARQHGDGRRIMRLYKFLLLFFKLEGRTKYSYYSLYTLAQAFYLLPPSLAHELVWNRTNNTRGKVDSNVENDRIVEHHNKTFKLDCRDFQGKVTSKSITRASHSYNVMNNIMDKCDHELHVKKPSGKHFKPNIESDVKALAKQFGSRNIFTKQLGRSYKAFPSFNRHLLEGLDMPLLVEWIDDKVKDFKHHRK